MRWLYLALTVLVGYLVGSVNLSLIVTKYIGKIDIYKVGSGNAGGTNVARSMGLGWGISVMAAEILKSMAFGLLAKYVFPGDLFGWENVGICFSGVVLVAGCLLGNYFPCFSHFKGGKGVSVMGGLLIVLDYRIFLAVLATFLINFGVNIVINTPLMMLYYELIMGKYYAPFDMVRIIKNLVEITPECIILMFVFRATIPSVRKLGFVTGGIDKLRFTKRHIALLAVLLTIAVVTVFAFSVYTYNTSSLSADYSKAERTEKNMSMIPVVTEQNASLEGETVVTIIESAFPKFMVK